MRKLLILALMAALMYTTAPAQAQPANQRITVSTAHRYAEWGMADATSIFDSRTAVRVGECTAGSRPPYVWHCASRIWTPTDWCTVDMQVWKDHRDRIMGEWHHMVCGPHAYTPHAGTPNHSRYSSFRKLP